MAVTNVLTMRTSLAAPRFAATAAVAQTSERALERIRAIPGVAAAAVSWGLPLHDNIGLPFDIGGRQNTGPVTGSGVAVPSSADYFRTLGIALLAGRGFDARDAAGAPPVVVINQAMAQEYWPDGSDPLGARIRMRTDLLAAGVDEPERQVIGMVGNVRQQGILGEPEPTMYFPHAQLSDAANAIVAGSAPIAWMVRTTIDPRLVAAAVHQVLREETGQPVTDIRLMGETWALSTSRQRLNMWLMTIFGGTALLLGAIGIYGLMAHTAQLRRQEIGIRMALGAQMRAVRNMVIKEGMRLVLIGVAVGLGAAYALANVLAAVLFGVQAHDVAVFVTVPVVLAAVAFAAVAVPAVRASRVDPTEALRHS
jgi:predicted permease